jgi:hypothetical protein
MISLVYHSWPAVVRLVSSNLLERDLGRLSCVVISVADLHPHGFGILDPHPESAVQMRIPDADADPD